MSKVKTAGWYAMQRLHGRPNHVIWPRFGGLGDHLMCSAVAREWVARGASKIWIISDHAALFIGNSDFASILPNNTRSFKYLQRMGLERTDVHYPSWNGDTDSPRTNDCHCIAAMCDSAGITGQIKVRPYLSLSQSEQMKGRVVDRQVVIQSTGLGAHHKMLNKEWYPERFQKVVDALRGQYNFIQIGMNSDPRLEGTLDLCGKTTVRESAALLSNSLLFVGLEGFLAHLSRAVECRAVIVFGGRTLPHQFGYSCNENLATRLPCSNCWKWNTCEFDRQCMRQISADVVIAAVERLAKEYGKTLIEDTWCCQLAHNA